MGWYDFHQTHIDFFDLLLPIPNHDSSYGLQHGVEVYTTLVVDDNLSMMMMLLLSFVVPSYMEVQLQLVVGSIPKKVLLWWNYLVVSKQQ